MSDLDQVEDEFVPVRTMNETEQAIADEVYAAVQYASANSTRGQQSADFRIGISDLGYCAERTRRMLDMQVPEPVDLLPAFTGTALGVGIEEACRLRWPDAITQSEVTVPLAGDMGTYLVTGHPDLLRPSGMIIDFKTERGLGRPQRQGPSQQQQFQRHCYAKGAWLGGFFDPGVALADVLVANVWMDRAADSREFYCHAEPYSEDVVTAATWWLEEVIYAHTHDQEARKEPPRQVCQETCGYFRTCRAFDTDTTGLITDDDTLVAVSMYREGASMEKAGRSLKDQAKSALKGVAGSTGQFAVRWTHVAGSHIEFDRKPSERLNITELK